MIIQYIKYQTRLKEQGSLIRTEKLEDTKISIGLDYKLPDDITLKNDIDIDNMCY